MNITKLKIRTYGDPCLKKVSSPVTTTGPAERLLFGSMIETMYAAEGVGLAAPQIGVNQRFFVIDIGEGPEVMINPKISNKSGSVIMEEGCLSLPGIHIMVKRPQKVVLQYIDHAGQKREGIFTDMKARAVSHELDHLDGKTILDHASAEELAKYKNEIAELTKINKKETA